MENFEKQIGKKSDTIRVSIKLYLSFQIVRLLKNEQYFAQNCYFQKFNETYSLIACDENNEELGILSFTIDKVERESVIEAFRVEEPHRNKGIGTLLLKSS